MALDIITTVLTPASTYNLTDLGTIKQELAIPDSDTSIDTWLGTKLTNISAAIQSYCNRTFAIDTIQDVIYFDRSGRRAGLRGDVARLQLSKWPIVAVTSVTLDIPETTQTLTEGTDFVTDQAKGQLVRLRESTTYPMDWWPVPTTVVYQAGFATVPADVVEACLKMLTKAKWQRGTNPTLKARHQPQSGFSEEYWISTGAEGNMTPDISDLLDNYRAPVVA